MSDSHRSPVVVVIVRSADPAVLIILPGMLGSAFFAHEFGVEDPLLDRFPLLFGDPAHPGTDAVLGVHLLTPVAHMWY